MCSYPRTAQHRATFRRFSTSSSSPFVLPFRRRPLPLERRCISSGVVSSWEAVSSWSRINRWDQLDDSATTIAVERRTKRYRKPRSWSDRDRRTDERRVCCPRATRSKKKKRSRSATCLAYDVRHDDSRRWCAIWHDGNRCFLWRRRDESYRNDGRHDGFQLVIRCRNMVHQWGRYTATIRRSRLCRVRLGSAYIRDPGRTASARKPGDSKIAGRCRTPFECYFRGEWMWHDINVKFILTMRDTRKKLRKSTMYEPLILQRARENWKCKKSRGI